MVQPVTTFYMNGTKLNHLHRRRAAPASNNNVDEQAIEQRRRRGLPAG